MSEKLWSVELGRGIGVIELGATREEVVRRLAEVKIELDADDDDDFLWVEEIDAELRFKTTSPPVLREIVAEDDRLRFASLPVISQRLHQVVELLKVADAETLWRIEREDGREESAEGRPADGVTTDEMLLDRGTLWIPSLGLGLGMVRGEITTLRLRKPEESPRGGIGPLTPQQRELSARANLPTYLLRPHDAASRGLSWVQFLLGAALATALGLLFWQAIYYQRQWNDAPVVEGDVIAVKPPPPEPFPSEFTVAYRDQAGGEHQTVFHTADVYIVRAVGEKVDVRYLPEAPDQPLGPARVRDAAFLKYTPWGIGIGAVYCVLQVLAGAVAWCVRRLKAELPSVKPNISEA